MIKDIFAKIGKFLTHRLFVLALVLIGFFSILMHRIFELQIVQGEQIRNDFSLRIIRHRELEAQRGNIYDRNGYPLAENILSYKVLLDGSIRVPDKDKMVLNLTEIIEKNGDKVLDLFPIQFDIDHNLVFVGSTSQILRFKENTFINARVKELQEKHLDYTANDMFLHYVDLFKLGDKGFSNEELLKIINIRYALWLKRYYQYQLETIALNISDTTLAEIEENISGFPGVTIVENPLRKYNDAKYFSHIIGYTGKISATAYKELQAFGYERDDIVGRVGVEKEMERYLNGINGEETIEVDNLGRTMNVLETTYPVSGKDVVLTIDKDLQIAAYNLLEQKLADIIQSKLSFYKSPYRDGDKSNTLMKDVFAALINNNTISVDAIEASEAGTAQNNIYTNYTKYFTSLHADIVNSITYSTRKKQEEYTRYYNYFIKHLESDGFLDPIYKDIEQYEKFNKNELSFHELLNSLFEQKLLVVEDIEEREATIQFISEHITTKYMQYNSFRDTIYDELIDKERFNYSDLCLTLVEQGVVSATEQQISQLKNRRLSTVDFMKQKIKNVEITPSEVAANPSTGSIVITDVNTGEVLALVSYPSYDNNRFVNQLDRDYFMQLNNDPTRPLYPTATKAQIAPGSTFKMITAMAGLEEGYIDASTKIFATGLFDKIYPPAKCWIYNQGGSHGLTDVKRALEVSCNHFFYEVGYRMATDQEDNFIDIKGVSVLSEYASKFGLAQSTGIEIGDAYYSSLADIGAKGTSRLAIGQNQNAYTPVQLARYTATVANGGTVYELNVIDKIMDNKGDVFFEKTPAIGIENDFDADNLNVVREGMLAVTSGREGSAKKYFKDFPIDVAGKTGSAQQIITLPTHGLFVAYAPFKQPEISLSCVIPFGYGSSNAAALSADVIKAYYDLKERDEEYVNEERHVLDY